METKLTTFIGCKQIEARPELKDGKEGYGVVYPDGYESWSPKDVFEKAYLPMESDSTAITPRMVDDFITHIDVIKMGDKTTVVKAVLANGYVVVESSSCVDPANYDEELGKRICMVKIENHIWAYLGFLLQSARNGFKR